MKTKKKFPLVWLAPVAVAVILILWCIYFPLTMFTGMDKDAEFLSATVLVDEVPETPAITFTTDEAQQLGRLVEELRKPRCRFFGWFSYITYNNDPLLHLIVTGKEGDENASLSLCADSDGFVYIQDNNIRLRAKNAALYDYLTELADSGKNAAALNDSWNYTPEDGATYTVRSAILGEAEKDYCRSVEFHYAKLDKDAKEWAVTQYTNFRDGWTENYLKANMAAVQASYTVDYDGTKTFKPSGKFERVFFLFFNPDIQKWEIWESTTAIPVEDGEEQKPPRPVGAYDAPNAVFTTELKPSSELKQIEVLINEEYLVCIDDPDNMTALSDMFLNATPIPYTPKTFCHDATVYFEYTDGTITPVTTFLNGFLYCLDDAYYGFAFRENGERLILYTTEVMYDLLDMENWDDAAKEKYRDTLNYFFAERN